MVRWCVFILHTLCAVDPCLIFCQKLFVSIIHYIMHSVSLWYLCQQKNSSFEWYFGMNWTRTQIESKEKKRKKENRKESHRISMNFMVRYKRLSKNKRHQDRFRLEKMRNENGVQRWYDVQILFFLVLLSLSLCPTLEPRWMDYVSVLNKVKNTNIFHGIHIVSVCTICMCELWYIILIHVRWKR